MMGQVDTHGLSRHLIVTDRLESPPVGGIDQHDDQGNADPRCDKVKEKALIAGITAQQVGSVGDGSEFVPLENSPDDLRKAQRGDRQIVAL